MIEGAASILSPDVGKAVMDKYLNSIKQDKEFSMLICDNKLFPLKSVSTERSSKVEISPEYINDACKGDGQRIYLHTHANFLPHPSKKDYEANEKIFSLPLVDFSCIAGTSGIFCTDKFGKDVVYPWGSNYYKAIESDQKISILRGDALFCDRKLGGKYDCEISLNGYSRPLGTFGNISIDGTSMIGESGTDILSQVHSPNTALECTVMNDEGKNSTLNCFKKNISEIEQARSTSKRCNFIDICHPKM